MSAALAHVESRTWRRFTPRQRLARFSVYLTLVAAVVNIYGRGGADK